MCCCKYMLSWRSSHIHSHYLSNGLRLVFTQFAFLDPIKLQSYCTMQLCILASVDLIKIGMPCLMPSSVCLLWKTKLIKFKYNTHWILMVSVIICAHLWSVFWGQNLNASYHFAQKCLKSWQEKLRISHLIVEQAYVK